MSETAGEQLMLSRMPARLFACTPSRLAALDCPRRYRFTYLDRPQPPRGAPWAHTTVGAVTHLALQRWWSLPRAYRTPDEGASLVERNWQPSGLCDDVQSMQACVTTAESVRDYLATQDPGDEPIGVERTVAARSERLAFSGRVDRIDERGDDAVVIDYKTGRRPPTTDDARDSQAMALYVLGVRRTLRRRCVRVELHHLPSGGVAAFDHTEESLQNHLARAERTAADIVNATDALAGGAPVDEVFPPAPSGGCSWCDFRQHCPEGRAASPAKAPWAALAEPSGSDSE